jgi:putative ABC transport system ATP-binding protein
MTLSLNSLAKSFRQGDTELKILENLDLNLRQSEIVAVIGESGSGKSTLLSLLAGFETPDRGTLSWNGDATHQWNEEQWSDFRKRSLGFVFQNYHLIPYLNALENVALPLRLNGQGGEQASITAKNLLTQLGLGQRVDHLPNQMSGGECQRVAIARALVHKPSLVLADEPTGSLDARTGQAVLDLLFSLLTELKQTALIVTHSSEVAARCHRVLTLRQGKLWPS